MYQPEQYWEDRLRERFTLSGVGRLSYSESDNAWLYRRKALVLGRVLQDVDLAGTTVLDIGCGTGFFVRQYLQRGARVVGMDITSVSVERLGQQFPESMFIQADIGSSSIRLPDERFSVINVWDVLYHIVDDAAFSQALKNIAACSARGTLLILSDALGAPASVAASPHVTLRPLSLYQRELPALGFELRSLTPLYFYLNNVQLQDQGDSMAEDFAKDEARQLISSTNLSVGCWIRM